jgi:hypothetical protein
MTQSLYSRLFAYRARPSRDPKEDFLTEALAHLLSRMPPDVTNSFITELLLPRGDGPQQAWTERFDAQPNGRWVTQFSIQNGEQSGRLDILYLDQQEKPVLIIENKISAFAGDEQMIFYSEWLRGQNLHGWPGVICFLTHTTKAPAGFAANHLYNTICRWSDVYKWLRQKAPSDGAGAVTPWKVFAKELADFLKEEEMGADSISERDIGALYMFINSGEKFRYFFEETYQNKVMQIQNLHHIREGICREPYHFEKDIGAIWEWIYLRDDLSPQNNNSWYIAWGLRLPEISSKWNDMNPRLPDRTHAFVVWTSDKRPFVPTITPNNLPNCDEWRSLPQGGAIAARALHCFPADSNELLESFGTWVQEKIVALLPVIQKAAHPPDAQAVQGAAGPAPPAEDNAGDGEAN